MKKLIPHEKMLELIAVAVQSTDPLATIDELIDDAITLDLVKHWGDDFAKELAELKQDARYMVRYYPKP